MTTYLDRRQFLRGAGLAAAAVVIPVGCGSGDRPAAGTGATTARAAAARTGPVRVGAFTDTSGSIGSIGTSHALAMQLAVEDVNEAGGVLGNPLEMAQVDTESDPSAAIPKVRQLIETRDVDVLVGGIFSSTREAVAPIITERANLIYAYPMIYEGSACNENLFLTGSVTQQNVLPAIEYAMDNGAERWVLVGHDYIYPRVANGLAADLIRERDGEVLADTYYPLDTSDFSDAVRRIVDADADAVVNNIVPPGMFTFYTQLGASGWNKTIVNPDADHLSVPAVGPENLVGTIASLDYVNVLDGPVETSIRERFEELSDGNAQFSGALGDTGAYRAIRFLAAAINEAGTTDAAEVREALVGLTLEDLPGGAARIEPDHHTAMNMYLTGFEEDGSMRIIEELGVIEPGQRCRF